MNYELAKELKEARFSQAMSLENRYYTHADSPLWGSNTTVPSEYVKVPTLEELIEACGDSFKGLIPNRGPLADGNSRWSAAADGAMGLGSTPAVAVANLWIALNNAKTASH